jgi:hypothetical protein
MQLSFKRAGMGTHGIIEGKLLSMRTVQRLQPNAANPNKAESMVESAPYTGMDDARRIVAPVTSGDAPLLSAPALLLDKSNSGTSSSSSLANSTFGLLPLPASILFATPPPPPPPPPPTPPPSPPASSSVPSVIGCDCSVNW